MLFPIIKVIDNDTEDKTPHIAGTNSHDLLKIDEKTGGIQYHNIQCCAGTEKYHGKSSFSFFEVDDEYWGPRIEMVTFEQLCEIYLEQTKQNVEQEAEMHALIKKIREKHDKLIGDSGVTRDGSYHTGGTLL